MDGRCGALFVLVNMVILGQPENAYFKQRLVHCLFKIIVEVLGYGKNFDV